MSDGPAKQASFLMPYGVAVFHGTVYVTDYLGQRVRAIDAHGNVRTVAGGGAPDSSGLRVEGAYRDGPALEARFNGPAGIAIDDRGRIFVADSGNQCIRVIENGQVRTYAGRPGLAQSDVAPIGFSYPIALAVDQDDTLYVGDFSVGIRRIDKTGVTTTIAIPAGLDDTVTSIVVRPWGLLVANGKNIIRIRHPGAVPPDYDATVPEPPVPWQTSHDRTIFAEDDVPVGYPFQLAVLDNGAYAYTDPRRTAVRLLANTETQDSSTWFAQSLSRTPPENYSASGGGFSDGARGQVQTPLGIAAIGPASVVFADAGNRRIRKISNIETRQYAEAAVPFGNYSDGTKYYRVLIISTCYAAYGVSFADSVPGRLEAQLEANRAQLGIARPVRVATVWLPTAATVRDYTRDMLSSGVADLVVWEFHDGMPNGEWSPQRYGLTSPLNGLDYWRTSMQPKIADIWKYMSAQRTPYYVLAIPTPLYFPSELAFANLAYRPLYQAKSWPEMASIYAGLFHGYSDGFIDAGPAMFAAEKQPDHRLLFLTSSDYQLSAEGQGIVAGVLYDNLARIRPWAQKH